MYQLDLKKHNVNKNTNLFTLPFIKSGALTERPIMNNLKVPKILKKMLR